MVFCWVLFLWLLLCCGFGGVTAYLFGMLPRATERFIFVTFGYTRPRIACAAARLCSRAPWCRARGSTHHRLPVPPRSMVPRVRQSARVFACAAALHGAARAAERRVFASAAALHGAARAADAVSSPVPPRSMVPRARQYASSSSCAAAPHGAARAAERRVFACAAALHGAARAAERRVFACAAALHGAARAAERHVFACAAALHGAARAAVRIIVFLCCRTPWCRARHNASSLRLVAAGWSGLL